MYRKICESQSSKFQVAKLWKWNPNPSRFEFPGSSDFSFPKGRRRLSWTWNLEPRRRGEVSTKELNQQTSKFLGVYDPHWSPQKMWGAKKWYLYADAGFQLFAIFFAYNWLLCHIQNLWIELHLTWSPKSCTRRSGPWPGLDVDLQTLGSKICSIFYPKYFVK